MTGNRTPTALRRAVLSATLLDQGSLVDLEIGDDGVSRAATEIAGPLLIAWGELILAAGDPTDELSFAEVGRRVTRWLRLRVALHDLIELGGDTARESVVSRVRPRALPRGHSLHPGPAWTRRTVFGDALEVGLGLRGIDDDARPDRDSVGLLPAAVLIAAGVDLAAAVARADRYLTDMAGIAAERLRRDPTAVLRPLGDADVLTLLASRTFRTALCDGQGMRSAAVPVRTRGWLDLGRLDPAFALSAALLTDPDDRGFERPVLVTPEEITLAKAGGDVVRQSLADPAPAEPLRPATRWA
jgi:hypothetical protein